ncbi:MAG TPA: sigma 54-interacting transcriptional regulator [Pyrinomonadaceae bacterium]
MRNIVTGLAEWKADITQLRSSYRRLAVSRLPVNLHSATAHVQRKAATLLHGICDGTGSWEELDGRQLADDERGDRISLLLGGALGGVALAPSLGRGLLAAAGPGTLFLTHIEKLAPAAQRVLCSVMETGRYTPVGDPYPRPIKCRLIVATTRPLVALARNYLIEWRLADVLGQISLRAESVITALETREAFKRHSGSLAAAS